MFEKYWYIIWQGRQEVGKEVEYNIGSALGGTLRACTLQKKKRAFVGSGVT